MDDRDTDNPSGFQERSRISMNELTERERLVAQEAAKLAVNMVMDEFYRNVGKSIIKRSFIVIGALAVGFGLARGWIQIPK